MRLAPQQNSPSLTLHDDEFGFAAETVGRVRRPDGRKQRVLGYSRSRGDSWSVNGPTLGVQQDMGKNALLVAYALTMVALIVSVDVLLFRHQFWPRLMVNVGIVLIFGAFYLRFASR
ncbi:hypothetical protein ABIA30_000559 [Mycobacterium sp. MAA66]|uniref:hypothetical protein n=1 Tax=Mycobacterium sp. MAA66 TaxID=3156297 RepID=UPI00351647B3